MYSYEIPQKRGYPKTVFYDDGIVLYYKDGREITIKTNDIERIEYVKPSFLNYLLAIPLLGGTYPGRMEVHLFSNNSLLNRVGKSNLYLIKISYNDIFKLPDFYKEMIGISAY